MKVEGKGCKNSIRGVELTEFTGALGLKRILLEADSDENIEFRRRCMGQASVVAVDKNLLVRRGGQDRVGKQSQERNRCVESHG